MLVPMLCRVVLEVKIWKSYFGYITFLWMVSHHSALYAAALYIAFQVNITSFHGFSAFIG